MRATLWGAFIHPLNTLTADEFLVGLGETANVVLSYGSSYSSGLFTYGNGDTCSWVTLGYAGSRNLSTNIRVSVVAMSGWNSVAKNGMCSRT